MLVPSSGNELLHGIFSSWYTDAEVLIPVWRTSKVIGYKIDDGEQYPIILNNKVLLSDDYYGQYYIEDANGVHPCDKLDGKSFKTVEEAKSHVMNRFKEQYPDAEILDWGTKIRDVRDWVPMETSKEEERRKKKREEMEENARNFLEDRYKIDESYDSMNLVFTKNDPPILPKP